MTDLELLIALGGRLDAPARVGGTVRDLLIGSLLEIRDRNGARVPLVPNRAQRRFAEHCGRRNIVLKARQLGITTYVAARFFLSTVTRPGTLTVQVAHDRESAEHIFRIVHRFLENLPKRLQAGALATSRDNVGQIVFAHLDSEYRVESAADSSAGRGMTIQNLHCSEVARWPRDAATTLASLRAAESGYVRHFFPWWFEETYRKDALDGHDLTEEERELMAQEGLDLEQIAYRRFLRSEFRGLAPQEYAEDDTHCFLASGECIFDLEKIEARLAECGEPSEMRDNGRLKIWLPSNGHDYMIGVDPAGGGSEGDYACASVIERVTGIQCAELRGHFTPQELASRVAALAREYHHALVAVERNNHGHAVLAHLARGEKYERLYEHGGQLGWLTSAVTRPAMLANLAAILTESPQLFSSRALLEECRTFVRHPDGNSSAAAGAHDDCVIAIAIALAVRQEFVHDRPALELATLPLR